MSMTTLAFKLERPADPEKLRGAFDLLVAALPDVPSIMEVRVIPNKDGDLVMIPVPISLPKEREAKLLSTLQESLAKNGLRIRKK